MAHVYAAVPELKLLKKQTGKSSSTTVLMGAYLTIIDDTVPDWYKVTAFNKQGWVRRTDTMTDDSYLKLFFVDVGQGDGCLIEFPGKRILVDGGQYKRNMKSYLTNYKYKWLLNAGYKVHIDTVVISHFDADHFGGLVDIIADTRFTFGTIFHNGIARFTGTAANRPDGMNTEIGKKKENPDHNSHYENILYSSFNDIDDAREMLNQGGLMATFRNFLEAVVKADNGNRISSMKRITTREQYLPGYTADKDLQIEILGPVPLKDSGLVTYPWLEDKSHTINGHSVILRLQYKDRSILLGGDLNTDSENYLLSIWEPESFQVDVAKSCHHGASEFTVDFLKATKPYATVFSSGDNENYAHPRADALGSSGRYSRGKRPLIFSTELARSYKGGEKIHYGLINCRTDGDKMVMAQMLEKAKAGDMWDSYTIP